MPSPRPLDATLVFLENGLPSTAVVPLEVLGAAGVTYHQLRGEPPRPWFRVRTVSLHGRPTRHSVPLRIQPETAFSEVRHTDLVVVSALGLPLEEGCRANAALVPWLQRMHRAGALVAGVCSGAALLAEAGLLDGRPATTHWAVAEECRRRYPRVRWQPERFVTEAGRVLCSGGVYASADLALHLVKRTCGHEVALQTARALLLPTPRTWQAAYAVEPPRAAHDDAAIHRVQERLARDFARPLSVEALAAEAAMSPRTFARRFKAATGERPLGYLHRVRIDAARHLLESRGRSVTEVGQAVGYEDEAFFRRLFRRHTGLAPRAYRSRFAPVDVTAT